MTSFPVSIQRVMFLDANACLRKSGSLDSLRYPNLFLENSYPSGFNPEKGLDFFDMILLSSTKRRTYL